MTPHTDAILAALTVIAPALILGGIYNHVFAMTVAVLFAASMVAFGAAALLALVQSWRKGR